MVQELTGLRGAGRGVPGWWSSHPAVVPGRPSSGGHLSPRHVSRVGARLGGHRVRHPGTRPRLCDDCKHRALAAEPPCCWEAGAPGAGASWVEQQSFQRSPHCPVCTECGASFTDERWKAAERVGWGASPEPHPSLCGDCDRRSVTDLQQAWPDDPCMKSRAMPCPSRRPAEPGSPASAGDATGPGCQWRGCKAARTDRNAEQLLRRRVNGTDHEHRGPPDTARGLGVRIGGSGASMRVWTCFLRCPAPSPRLYCCCSWQPVPATPALLPRKE